MHDIEQSNPYRGEPPSAQETDLNIEDKVKMGTHSTSSDGRKPIKWAIVGAVIGFVVGSNVGIASLGTAVNGGLIFAAIGGTVGFLAANQRPRS